MDECVTEDRPPAACDDNLKEADSVVNFQKFIYDLFEKNGILNDLRAYLRGHIIDVLKSSQTGEQPICQKNFTQRLELTFQALNMLIAEYLLRLEFSYSLSVFVSEIPLANMVFDFAKKLMLTNNGDFEDFKFKDNDVWSILNYLGVKCDSEHATSILELYNSKENLPLLLCILKCMPLYQNLHKGSAILDQENSLTVSLASSAKSADMKDDGKMQATSASKIASHEKCKHYACCNTCQSRVHGLKEKYKMKTNSLMKTIQSSDSLNIDKLMKNIGVMEKSLVEEMFQELKSVYEAEVVMLKQEEDTKIKRSLASHELQLQKRRDELEESFKAREEELERNVQEKKKFLWGLARALRDQHANMSRAMLAVKDETERLTAKEECLKSQLLEAEDILRKRGEDMRNQITNELKILEEHLESMKQERENIHKERSELDNLKTTYNSDKAIKVQDLNNEELHSHYDLLRNEVTILKKYLETTKLEPKCMIERSTLTELSDVTSKIHLVLNNAHEMEKAPSKLESEERMRTRTPNKVVNDLKKQKNNNCAAKVDELYHENIRVCDRSRSRSSSEAGDVVEHETEQERDMFNRLQDENERLKNFARQQREHIDDLSSQQARLQAELTAAHFQTASVSRPRTAPTIMPSPPFLDRLNLTGSANSIGWQKGAGEEISTFSNAQPRILLPGDTVPFVGALRDQPDDNRRHLINQWRALRRRMSPIGGVGKVRTPTATSQERVLRDPRPVTATSTVAPPVSPLQEISQLNETFTFQATPRERPETVMVTQTHQPREKSPKSVLRESKENLRNNKYTKERPQTSRRARSPSPGEVLKEAKLRLRKLEIEAEAVEKSYLEFRKRLTESKRDTRHSPEIAINNDKENIADIKKSRSRHKTEDSYRKESTPRFAITLSQEAIQKDFVKYLCEYQSKFNGSASHFKTNSVVEKSKNIPVVCPKIESKSTDSQEKRDNYLETPLTEFRKLYHTHHSQKSLSPIPFESPSLTLLLNVLRRSESPEKISEIHNVSNNNNALSPRGSLESQNSKREFEILKENFSKMYNLQDHKEIEHKIEGSLCKSESPRLLDLEEISEVNSLNIAESNNAHKDLMLVVESTVDSREIVGESQSDIQKDIISTQMTIIVCPKRSQNIGSKEGGVESPHSHRSPGPVKMLTRNDRLDAIFHADATNRRSSIEMQLNTTKYVEDSDYEKGVDDSPDDFSTDVDNYNSRSDYNNSPISLPKSTGDEHYWDS